MSSDTSSQTRTTKRDVRHSFFIDDTVNDSTHNNNGQENNNNNNNLQQDSFAVYIDRSFMGTTPRQAEYSSIRTSSIDTADSSNSNDRSDKMDEKEESQSSERNSNKVPNLIGTAITQEPNPIIRHDRANLNNQGELPKSDDSQATQGTGILEQPLESGSPQRSQGHNSDHTVSTTALDDATDEIHRNSILHESDINFDTHDPQYSSTPIRHDRPLVDHQNKTHSSLFQYDETIEPDIEEAVKLLKKEMKVDQTKVNHVKSQARQSVDNYSFLQGDTSRYSVEFHPQVFHMISKSSSSQGSSIPHQRPVSQIMHSPRSPSLINKFIVNQVLEQDTQGSPLKQDPVMVPLWNSPLTRNTTAANNNRNINRLSNGGIVGLPKIPILRRVSGPSKWARTDIDTDRSSPGHFSAFEPRSPLQRLYQTSLHEDTDQAEMMGSNPTLLEMPDLEAHPHIPHVPHPENSHHSPSLPDINAGSEIPQQRINNSSVESFDSEKLEFKDIYSIRRIMITISLCIICPVIFFMIGVGSRAGINDYRIMKMILNDEHRIGLLKGFIWDVKVNWFRHLCLMLGIIELLVVAACIGIGFGVGLHT
ncbi:similar to Saccharomyces cerevisiae YGR041W BUD9 Protein involved in bud-site selection [Maudiozyma barnettii]|uniref:Similar to Saccharomyces cerevisiae YGR041W BUD9 Protein involved in bud-site selection n=1 Tax=Maudiozyma barnettii TaxID=61262 RepID=A0A8H2VKW7_9SACH|nr:uncharacterized protein KABA2_14S00858 [Kazachstania barnettii]CAB4257292.1 similar to Saccharomyces cerevisiae YGR041W BUD9 Protein involved in bud-site selection [Kazachstania barnettii]CAD1784557.1 similar to Saccharomyces cerevisiae YGR041W BUD9 Protein involved in bud-site selection [Kazachstania barnettii]